MPRDRDVDRTEIRTQQEEEAWRNQQQQAALREALLEVRADTRISRSYENALDELKIAIDAVAPQSPMADKNGFYLIVNAPQKDMIGSVVRVQNGYVNEIERGLWQLIAMGFAFESVHVLKQREYTQLTADTETIPHYEAIKDPLNATLRHCAFCGGSATLGQMYHGKARRNFLWYVECQSCGVKNEGFKSREEAATWWNHRDTRVVNPPLVISGVKAEIKLLRGEP